MCNHCSCPQGDPSGPCGVDAFRLVVCPVSEAIRVRHEMPRGFCPSYPESHNESVATATWKGWAWEGLHFGCFSTNHTSIQVPRVVQGHPVRSDTNSPARHDEGAYDSCPLCPLDLQVIAPARNLRVTYPECQGCRFYLPYHLLIERSLLHHPR